MSRQSSSVLNREKQTLQPTTTMQATQPSLELLVMELLVLVRVLVLALALALELVLVGKPLQQQQPLPLEIGAKMVAVTLRVQMTPATARMYAHAAQR